VDHNDPLSFAASGSARYQNGVCSQALRARSVIHKQSSAENTSFREKILNCDSSSLKMPHLKWFCYPRKWTLYFYVRQKIWCIPLLFFLFFLKNQANECSREGKITPFFLVFHFVLTTNLSVCWEVIFESFQVKTNKVSNESKFEAAYIIFFSFEKSLFSLEIRLFLFPRPVLFMLIFGNSPTGIFRLDFA